MRGKYVFYTYTNLTLKSDIYILSKTEVVYMLYQNTPSKEHRQAIGWPIGHGGMDGACNN